MTSPIRAARTARRRRLAVTLGLLLAAVGLTIGVLTGPGGHTFAADRPTVLADPTARPSRSASASPRVGDRVAPSATPTPSASPGKLQLLGLGDSVTAAANCDCTDFITQLGSRLADADDVQVASVNQGVNGATAADLDDDLSSDDDLRHTVAGSDIVVVTIGANDLAGDLSSFTDGDGCSASCYDPDVADMADHLRSAVQQIHRLRGTAPTTIVLTTYWNVFTDGDVAAQNESADYPAWSDQITRAANAAICGVADRNGAMCVDLYTPFKRSDGSGDPTSYLADDGDHPNADGEKLITDALFSALTAAGGQAIPR